MSVITVVDDCIAVEVSKRTWCSLKSQVLSTRNL